VADPGYDFFATGAPAGTAEPTNDAAPAPAVSRFGTPLPQDEAVPAAAAYAPPAAAAPVAPAPVPGYHPGAVNQFGTPTDLPAVPTGPYAAPGVGAAPIEAPGLVSTWSGPAVPDASAQPVATAAPVAATAAVAAPLPPPPVEAVAAAPVAVSRFGSPIPPDVLVEDPTYAALAFGTSVAGTPGYAPPAAGHRAGAAASADAKPGAVSAAGIIGIVEGGLLILLGLLGLMGYLALKSQLDALAASPELAGSGLSVSSLTNLVLVGVLIALLIGAGYVVAGIATLRGARWGAWALLVVSAINVLYGVYELLSGDAGFGTLLSIGVSGAVVVLLCLADSMRWLRRA
jgi:hypothetical protein